MARTIVTDINYAQLKEETGLPQENIKDFLDSQIDQIYALLFKIDIGVAGQTDTLMLDALAEIKSICRVIQAHIIYDSAHSLENLLVTNGHDMGALHYQMRLDAALHNIRRSLLSYQEIITDDF
jgi:hypothetical protein